MFRAILKVMVRCILRGATAQQRGEEEYMNYEDGRESPQGQQDLDQEIAPKTVRFSPGPGLPLWGDLQAPINLVDALDDLENDCIRISERATENARALTDILDTLLWSSSVPISSQIDRPDMAELE